MCYVCVYLYVYVYVHMYIASCGVEQWVYSTSQFHILKLTLSIHLQAPVRPHYTHAARVRHDADT